MSKSEQRDLIKCLEHLTSMVQIRNAAKIQAMQGPSRDKKTWVQLYNQSLVEIEETEHEIAALMPSGRFQRKLFVAIA